MQTIKCPQQDNGICTIPDRAAVITEAGVQVWSRDEIEATFPNLELASHSMLRIRLPDNDAIESVLREGAPAARDVEEALLRGFERTPAAAAVVVQCSCGHRYIAPA